MQRYFSKKKEGNYLILDSNDYYHIKTVMRMKPHDNIQVVYEEIPYLCEIENDFKIKIIKQIPIYKDNLPEVTLLIPLLKEQKFDFILQKSTELGVKKIIPIVLSRSIIKLENGKEKKKLDRWQKIMKEASEQCYRTEIPTISNVVKIDDLDLKGVNLICSTNEKEKNIKTTLKEYQNCDKINILVGPEGGITDIEEEKLKDKGFIPVTLGSRIMRVETVPIFILSIINYESME